MTEIRPSGETDGAARLAAAAHARLEVARADLDLPEAWRLGEWQRRTVASLFEGLVRAIETELRGRLAAAFAVHEGAHASLASAHVEIAWPILSDASASDPALLAILLRRAEEHRLFRLGSEHNWLVELAGDSDPAVAGEAMSLLIASASRLDAFQEPLMLRTELTAELEHALVWTVAAALRRYLVGSQNVVPAEADAAIAEAAGAMLGDYDEGESFAARSLRLMRRLAAAGRLDDALAVRSLAEGGLPLFLGFVCARTGFAMDPAWELLSDPSARGGALLLRAAGIGKEAAGAILFRLLGQGEAVSDELDRFESLSADAAFRLLGLWQADPAYRAAVARLVA